MKSHNDVQVGDTFGYLTVIGKAVSGDVGYYLPVMCSCGRPSFALWSRLSSGSRTSCGCHQGNRTHGFRRTRLYGIWSNMKQRCFNSNNSAFVNYGGRGILVCEEWMKFEAFKDWALSHGYTDEMTIERKDNSRGYQPDNCSWIPSSAQANNRRSTRWVEHAGERKSLREWSNDERCVVKYNTLYARIRNGWPVSEALTTPVAREGGDA